MSFAALNRQALSPPPPCRGGQIYAVQQGESLYSIANKFGVPLNRLIAANPQIVNPNRGFFQLGISYLLFAAGIRRVAALEATLIQVLNPILSPVWAFLVLGELPGTMSLLGGSIVLVAVTARSMAGSLKHQAGPNQSGS